MVTDINEPQGQTGNASSLINMNLIAFEGSDDFITVTQAINCLFVFLFWGDLEKLYDMGFYRLDFFYKKLEFVM